MRKKSFKVSGVIAYICLSTQVFAQVPDYTVTEHNTPGLISINGTPSIDSRSPTMINNNGIILGTIKDASGLPNAYVYDSNQQIFIASQINNLLPIGISLDHYVGLDKANQNINVPSDSSLIRCPLLSLQADGTNSDCETLTTGPISTSISALTISAAGIGKSVNNEGWVAISLPIYSSTTGDASSFLYVETMAFAPNSTDKISINQSASQTDSFTYLTEGVEPNLFHHDYLTPPASGRLLNKVSLKASTGIASTTQHNIGAYSLASATNDEQILLTENIFNTSTPTLSTCNLGILNSCINPVSVAITDFNGFITKMSDNGTSIANGGGTIFGPVDLSTYSGFIFNPLTPSSPEPLKNLVTNQLQGYENFNIAVGGVSPDGSIIHAIALEFSNGSTIPTNSRLLILTLDEQPSAGYDVTLTFSPPGQKRGVTGSFEAIATTDGGAGPLEYRFIIKDKTDGSIASNTGWQNSSQINIAPTTSGMASGNKYSVKVKVRDTGNNNEKVISAKRLILTD